MLYHDIIIKNNNKSHLEIHSYVVKLSWINILYRYERNKKQTKNESREMIPKKCGSNANVNIYSSRKINVINKQSYTTTTKTKQFQTRIRTLKLLYSQLI